MKKIISITSIAAIAILTSGCVSSKVNPLEYKTQIKAKINVPEICKAEYKVNLPKVAVVDFTNNSTFGKANISNTDINANSKRNSSAVFGAAAVPGAIVGGVASSSKSSLNANINSSKRNVDAKLSKTIVPLVEGYVLKSGGAKLFSRTDMNKIDTELKFQDSGLVDPKSIAKFGKLAGVKYLVTGSIDYVEQNMRSNSGAAKTANKYAQKSDNQAVKIIGTLLSLGTALTDGMIIKTGVTIKVIDVETGSILLSKQIKESNNIGKFKNPSYDQIVGGIKASIVKALPQIEEDFTRYFAQKAYVTKIRAKGEELVAQINLGTDNQVKEKQIFEAYVFQESTDPLTGKKSCDKIKSDVKLTATDRITKTHAWTVVDNAKKGDLKILQLVQKSSEKAGFALPF